MPTPITLDFGAISGGGTVTVVPSVQAAEGNLSFGANPSVIDIDFTGTFTGSVEVCIGYDPAQYYAGSSILLFHYIGGAWVDVTSSVDEPTRRVCGLVSSFSPFAAGEELAVYSVTYDANEGTLAGGEDTSYTFGESAITEPVDPTRTGYDFEGWFLDDGAWTTLAFPLTPIENTTVYAKWVIATYDVVVTIDGDGDVTDGAAGDLSCDETDPAPAGCTENYDYNDDVTLTATAAAGFRFGSWSGTDAGECTGDPAGTCTFTDIQGDKAVTAEFTETTAPVLSAVSGTGLTTTSGTLNFTSDEAGTYYYLVYAAADDAPNAATIKLQGVAVTRGTAAASATAQAAALSGLNASTVYTVYLFVEDAVENQSSVADVDFTTSSGGGGGGGGVLPVPVNLVTTQLSGYSSPGASVTATSGTWNYANTYAYQWYQCTSASTVTEVTVPSTCTKITGATSASYVITALDSGSWLRVKVSATGSGGATDILSASSAQVGPKPESVKARPPRVMNGLASAGSTLAAKRGQWTNGPVTYAYQWYRCTKAGLKNPKSVPVACTAITGATAKTYTVKAADKGSFLRVRVTATGVTGQGFRMSRTTGVIPN